MIKEFVEGRNDELHHFQIFCFLCKCTDEDATNRSLDAYFVLFEVFLHILSHLTYSHIHISLHQDTLFERNDLVLS